MCERAENVIKVFEYLVYKIDCTVCHIEPLLNR